MSYSTTFFSSIYKVSWCSRRALSVGPKDIFTQARKISSRGNGMDSRSTGMTVRNVRELWHKEFVDKNIPEPDESVNHILAYVLQLKNVEELNMAQHQFLNPEIYERVQKKMELRLKRMPVQYVIEEWDFFGMTLKMSPPVFIPRPETEDLVSIISAELLHHPAVNQTAELNCLEIGCGTGAISLALLSNHSMLNATAIDANPKAVTLARQNAILQSLDKRISIFWEMLNMDGSLTEESRTSWNGKFDFLVSNPPYIPSDEITSLDPEILKFESHLALDGGPDGISLIEVIVRHGPKWLKRGGTIFLEIDPRQVSKIEAIVQSTQLYQSKVIVKKDCFQVDRFIILKCK